MSEAIGTLGTSLKRGTQHIAQVQDISGPDLSTDTDEITDHYSPDGVEAFIPTIKRTGEMTFPLVFLPLDPAHDDTGLLAVRADRSPGQARRDERPWDCGRTLPDDPAGGAIRHVWLDDPLDRIATRRGVVSRRSIVITVR